MTFLCWCNIVDYSPAKGLGKILTNNIFNIVIFDFILFSQYKRKGADWSDSCVIAQADHGHSYCNSAPSLVWHSSSADLFLTGQVFDPGQCRSDQSQSRDKPWTVNEWWIQRNRQHHKPSIFYCLGMSQTRSLTAHLEHRRHTLRWCGVRQTKGWHCALSTADEISVEGQ